MLKANVDAIPNPYVSISLDSIEDLEQLRIDVSALNGIVVENVESNSRINGDLLTKDKSWQNTYRSAESLNIMPSELAELYIVEHYSESEIPILLTLESAASITGNTLDFADKESIARVYDESIGYAFSLDICNIKYDENGIPGNLDDPDGIDCVDSVKYKIVGIIPSFSSDSINGGSSQKDSIPKLIVESSRGRSVDYVLAAKTSEFVNHYTVREAAYPATIVRFSNLQYLLKFVDQYSCGNKNKSCQKYHTSEYLGAYLSIYRSFESFSKLCISVVILLSILAAIVFVFNVAKIIDDENQLINLYRIVGASSKDIKNIYFFYVAKMSVISMVLSILISLIVAIIVFMIWRGELLTSISFMFSSSRSRTLIESFRIGIDWNYLLVLLGVPIAGILGFILSARKFSKVAK